MTLINSRSKTRANPSTRSRVNRIAGSRCGRVEGLSVKICCPKTIENLPVSEQGAGKSVSRAEDSQLLMAGGGNRQMG